MINMQRNNQASEAKNLIYPEQKSKKNEKNFHKKNLNELKSKQKEIRDKKYEEENSQKPEPYKMKMFKNVESKLAKQITLNKTNGNNEIDELKRELQTTKPREKRNPSVGIRAATSGNNVKLPDINIYNKNNPNSNNKGKTNDNKKESAKKDDVDNNVSASESNIQIIRHFPNENLLKEEEVLANIKKKLNKNSYSTHNTNNHANILNSNTSKEENIYNNSSNNREDNDVDALVRENELLQQRLNELNRQDDYSNELKENKQYSSKHRKSSAKDQNCKTIENSDTKNKQKKNYILDNKNKIQEIQPKPPKSEEQPSTHKNFGKVPEYLQKYKMEIEEKKENEKKLAEESKYPKGTRLLSEDERVQTLNSLQDTRKELVNMLEKMPITMKTMSIQKKKEELEKKLNEIEEAIKTFSKKQVFIKDDTA